MSRVLLHEMIEGEHVIRIAIMEAKVGLIF